MANVGRSTIQDILQGAARIEPATEQRILALPAAPALATVAPKTLVDSTGTTRRLRALAAIGWSAAALAAHAGSHRYRIDKALNGCDRVTAVFAATVVALYDDLWDQQPPAENKGQRRAATLARRRAQAEGWAPPLAWDDESLDDPSATPSVPSGSVTGDQLDEWLFLVRAGEDPIRAAHRLGYQAQRPLASIRVQAHRANRPDVIAVLDQEVKP